MPKNVLEKYLYKLLLVKESNSIVFIFAFDTNCQHTLSTSGKPIRQISHTVHYVDLTKTRGLGQLIIDKIVIDLNKFEENIEIYEAVDDDIFDLKELAGFTLEEINSVAAEMQSLSQIYSSIRQILGPTSLSEDGDEKSAFVVSNEQSNLAGIVFSTVTGETALLTEDDRVRMGEIIMNVILDNLDIDESDEKAKKKLQDEIDYKLIEALPNKMKTHNVQTNINAVIQEIKKFRDGGNGDLN